MPLDYLDFDKVVYLASAAFPNVADEKNPSPSIGCIYGKPSLTEIVQEVIPRDYLRLYTSRDSIGGQIGSALKNVIALAAGIASGLGYGEMTIASLASRGLNEIMTFAVNHGGYPHTFFGRNTIEADLFGTCLSDDSHNRSAGRAIAKGCNPETIRSLGTVEGIATTKALWEIPEVLEFMPISKAVANILFDGIDPKKAVKELLDRPIVQPRAAL